jgi:hypothetical protein
VFPLACRFNCVEHFQLLSPPYHFQQHAAMVSLC